MPNPIQRPSLVTEVEAALLREIELGTWREWLPGERPLCESLQVGRTTLRKAVTRLKRRGLVEVVHGSGTRVLTRKRVRRAKRHEYHVALLAREPLQTLRPMQALWIDGFRAMLAERGGRLHVFSGTQYFRAGASAKLKKLVEQNPHGCWVLAMSNEAMQRWFHRNQPRCIVAGSVYPGVDLPFRDLDHSAVCRHAAGVLLAAGHRKVAFLVRKSRLAGDVESEQGFRLGMKLARSSVDATISYHDESVRDICRTLDRLMTAPSRPTALFVANAYCYLVVVSRLAQLGLRIPDDVSVISRDDSPFMSYLLPTPARYVVSTQRMAKSLLKLVLDMYENEGTTQGAVRLMPEFTRGGTLAAPPVSNGALSPSVRSPTGLAKGPVAASRHKARAG